ncbi:TIGR03086 family protein [Prauserella marina]|nr:TIGR03086 family metal-binding protein [Prauserella marina]ASR38354.1 TIGR03086 family protein [Prauserella marina]
MSEQVRGALRSAAAEFHRIVEGIRPDQLTAPTPCTDYDVKALCNHLLYWGPRLASAARKQPPPGADGGESSADLVRSDWAERLGKQTEDLLDALSADEAWQGTTSMGGPSRPASMIGAMVLCELVLHGWDLAKATRQRPPDAEDAAEAIERVMADMAEQGRLMKVFGDEVAVGAAASSLEKALGAAGRSPSWSPQA